MRASRTVFLTAVILVAAEDAVYAYTDPGSGSLVLQLLFAAVFGVLFYVREIADWVRGLLKGPKRLPPRPTAKTDD